MEWGEKTRSCPVKSNKARRHLFRQQEPRWLARAAQTRKWFWLADEYQRRFRSGTAPLYTHCIVKCRRAPSTETLHYIKMVLHSIRHSIPCAKSLDCFPLHFVDFYLLWPFTSQTTHLIRKNRWNVKSTSFIQTERAKQRFFIYNTLRGLSQIIGNLDESSSPAPYCGSHTAWTLPPHVSEAEL